MGAMPTAEHFTDLIDSSLNTLEEGFDKTVEQGFKVSALADNATLVSFYRDSAPQNSLWSISFDLHCDSLLFKKNSQPDADIASEDEQAVLSLTQKGFVGINNAKPARALDIKGVIKSDGRIGSQQGQALDIPADGNWHNISPKLEGCQAFEIMAGVGIKRSGRYGFIHATALNTCNPTGFWSNIFNRKNPIKSQHGYYNSSADKLKLRWIQAETDVGSNESYRPYYLQIRSNSSYGEGVLIRYHISKLWFDAYMQGSQSLDDEAN